MSTSHHRRDAFVDYGLRAGTDRLRVLTNRPTGWQPVAELAWTEQPDWDPATNTPNTSAAAGSNPTVRALEITTTPIWTRRQRQTWSPQRVTELAAPLDG